MLGGFVGTFGYRMPLFVSATASGIALLLGIFLLQESNPRVLARKGVKDVVNGKVAGDAGVESGDANQAIDNKSSKATQTNDTKNGDTIQNDTKNGDTIQNDTKNGESIQNDTKNGESIQNDTKNGDTIQNDTKNGDTKQTKPSRPRVTKLMLLCFLHEFCIRWVAMAYNSRYNIYITDRWNVPSTVFSYYITAQSVWYFFQQFFIYP
ncbi:hypothetical protein WA538_001839 [Blastocystis sp. DL]